MNNRLIRFLLLVIAILISSIINRLYIDSLLNVFNIMSYFALVSNRVALALFIYYTIEVIFIIKEVQFKHLVNKLFIIYFIWLIGLLFGRFVREHTLRERFNFTTFLPLWIHHFNLPLVRYYILGNLLVYLPFGLFLRYHFKLVGSILMFFFIIIFIEFLQGFTGLGYFDIDDILLNGVSGFIGIFLMELSKRFFITKEVNLF